MTNLFYIQSEAMSWQEDRFSEKNIIRCDTCRGSGGQYPLYCEDCNGTGLLYNEEEE